MARFSFILLGLALLFGRLLWDLGSFAFHSELYSYILLIPAVSLALCWRRPRTPEIATGAVRRMGVALVLASAGAFVAYACWNEPAEIAGMQNRLALGTLAFVAGLSGVCCLCRPGATRRHVFSLGLLLLLVPIPPSWADRLAGWLQYSSAWLAATLLELTGMPVYQSGSLDLKIPGISLHVAPECSGFHSTLALAITALIAGYVYLRSPWRRAIFCLAAFPLGVIRNAFRIFTIAQLCVRLGPEMIDSFIHRKGGWIFFLLFLGPALLLLNLLRRSERGAPPCSPSDPLLCRPSALPLERR